MTRICVRCLEKRTSPCEKMTDKSLEEHLLTKSVKELREIANQAFDLQGKLKLADTTQNRMACVRSVLGGEHLKYTNRYQQFLAWKEAKQAFQELLSKPIVATMRSQVQLSGPVPFLVYEQQEVVHVRAHHAGL